MKVIKFEQGQKVARIVKNEIKIGTIVNMYSDLDDPIAVVDFDGDYLKVPVGEIAPYEEPKKEDPKEKEPKEKESITITPDKFRKIVAHEVSETLDELGPEATIMSFAFITFAAQLHRVLFMDEAESD